MISSFFSIGGHVLICRLFLQLKILICRLYGTLNGHSIAYGSMESLRCVAQWTLYDVQLNGVFTVYSTMNTL